MENASKKPYVAAGFFLLALLSMLFLKWFDFGELGAYTLRAAEAMSGTKRYLFFGILSILGAVFSYLGAKSKGFTIGAIITAILSIALFYLAYSVEKADGFGLDYVGLGFWVTGIAYVGALVSSVMSLGAKKNA